MDKKELNKNKEFRKVNNVKKFQNGVNTVVNIKTWQSVGLIAVVLAVIVMLILMAFRQNAVMISKNNPEPSVAMTYDEVQPGDEATNSDFVQFDAYFLKDINNDGVADKVRGTCNEIRTSDDLYMDLTVLTNGYLKDAKITINSDGSEEDGNFYFTTEIAADSQIKQDYVSDNTRTIEFNQLENGTHVLLSGKVEANNYIYSNNKSGSVIRTENDYSKINSVILTGTHVEVLEDGSTRETQIEKKVEFQVDWYGTLEVEWYSSYNNQTNDANIILDKEKESLNVKFRVYLRDTKGSNSQLLFKTGYIEGILPEINGYAPIEVKLITNNYGSSISYDKDTRKFVIEGNDFNNYDYYYYEYIEVSYPLEAYNAETDSEKSIEVQVKGWIEGYNNPNKEFQNPYKSNEAENTLKIKLMRAVTVPRIFCHVGDVLSSSYYNIYREDLVSKEKPARIYNGISETETEDYYRVYWSVTFSRDNGYLPNGVILKESKDGQQSDEFIKSDKTTDSMEELTTNVGIYFGTSYLNSTLGENGWLKVYNDETDELLVTFTKENWSQYNYSNPYKYQEPVKHIRIETSAIDVSSFSDYEYLYIYNIKELDDKYIITHYTKEEFDNLKQIKSYVYMYTQTVAGEKEVTNYGTAAYIYPITGVGMDLDNNDYYTDKAIVSTQQERDMKIRIGIPDSEIYKSDYGYGNEKLLSKWVDGEYLIKLPQDIIDLKINSITPDKENIQITNYETYEEEGNIYIKIKTKNETPEFYTITLDCTITPNPGSPTQDEEVELYAFNKNAVGDYEPDEVEDTYDVNDNGNVSEIIGYTTRTISFVASNSLVTGQRATNYDEKGSIAISPKIAYISKSQGTAKIEMDVTNNYSGTIGEIDILGKIPNKGNTYAINGNDLGSTYNTTMTNEGIQVPDELKDKVTIYYSEQINPTKDLDDLQNGWLKDPTDFSKVKSFLIDLGDYELQPKESYTFTYEVNIPEGLDYNEVSYSHHGVYFTLNTNAGTLDEQTEPAKLGLMIAEPYNIEITKYERKTDTVVPGATYSVAENGEDEVIGITDENGKLTIKDLFAENEYTLKETISPEGYELNTDEIIFETYEENGKLKVQINSGTVKKAEMIEDEHGDKVLQIEVEDAKEGSSVSVPVHHYIYDEEEGYTTDKVKLADGTEAQDEVISGYIGDSYETNQVENLDKNYKLYEIKGQAEGTLTKDMEEIIYYYKLKETNIVSSIEKTVTIGDEEDTSKIPVLTEQDGVVTYNIKYKTQITDYKGTAKIVVTDKLPAEIDEYAEGVDLAEGIYNEDDNTITWEEVVEIDTYTNGTYTYNFDKTIKLVYVNQDLTQDLVNTAYGEVTIYYPENYEPNPGGEKDKNKSDEVTATVGQNYKIDKNVKKVWEDNNDTKEKRPDSVTIELLADGEVVENSQVELNSRNGWKHTYKDLDKYDEKGLEIEYSVVETETNEGDLEYYEEPEINETDDGIIITNRYKLKETALKSDITKETETVITASSQEVPYTIHYEAEIDEYIGEAVVTIVDELPYKIDEEKSSLDGGEYNEELQTITWKEEIEHINTDTLGEAYKIDITKNIVLVYKELDATQSKVTNKVKGEVELYETEEKNTVETQEDTQVEIEGTVVVKYVEKGTEKELETAEEMTGRAGEDYVTIAKDIENYTLVGDTENTRGEYKEGTIEVIYYYEKTPAKVIIKYEDEEGKDIKEERVVEGYVTQSYETKAEEIEGYELVEVKGQEKGEMTKEDIIIIYVYKHIEAGGVRVQYLDKETGEKLAEDEILEGNIGDEYKTERKEIDNYQKADPEPTNAEGTMTEEEIIVTYYYEKIPSGKITVRYVDKDTKEDITYEDETGEEKTYGYEIKGYVGEKYKTEEKEIPYYKIVENILPVNREGILSQNDETVIYYYEKMSFNMEISKKVKTITIKGEEKEVSNGSLTKVEIHRKEITTTPVEIRYVITVSNTGEIDGKGEVIEKIPEGFEVSSNNPSGWEVNTDGTMKYTVELKAGESKDIEVVLKWKASETNFGEKKNVALIENIENPAGFEEENTEDNKAEATVIVTVATGKEVSILIIVLGFIASAGSLILCYEYELYRKERNQPVRMVKLEGKNVVIKKEVQK